MTELYKEKVLSLFYFKDICVGGGADASVSFKDSYKLFLHNPDPLRALILNRIKTAYSYRDLITTKEEKLSNTKSESEVIFRKNPKQLIGHPKMNSKCILGSPATH